jgi:hypothetical protein
VVVGKPFDDPTAQPSLDEDTSTPYSVSDLTDPAGMALHLVPFQATAVAIPELPPTAMASRAPNASTDQRAPRTRPGTAGWLYVLPSHRSIKGTVEPPTACSPTIQTSPDGVTATSWSPDEAAPSGASSSAQRQLEVAEADLAKRPSEVVDAWTGGVREPQASGAARASWIARQIRSGPSGMSM